MAGTNEGASRIANPASQTIALKSVARLEIRCSAVAHKSLTPFSNENGVTLMAIGYREYQVRPDCA
jgi:hypothetical protein